MFEKEAEEYSNNWKINKNNDLNFAELVELRAVIYKANKDGAEFGYNKGYHDAEEHYLNVIDSQHKLVDESRKKDFKKCMKCTDGTYQYGFKDGYNKANEWHYPSKGEYPKEDKRYLCRIKTFVGGGISYECFDYDTEYSSWEDVSGEVIAWKEIVLPKESE